MKENILRVISQGYRIYNPFTGKTIGTKFNESGFLVWYSEGTRDPKPKSYKTITGAFNYWDLNK